MQEHQEIGQFQTKSGKQVMIRSLSRDDVAVLMDFMNAVSAEDTYLNISGEQFTHSEEEQFVIDVCDHMLAGNYLYFLAFVGQQLVGTVSVRRMVENRRRTVHVGEVGLIVARAFRGKGIGSELLRLVIEQARKMDNMHLLRLWVFGTNQQAKQLYANHGFKPAGAVPGGVYRRGEYIDHELMYLPLQ